MDATGHGIGAARRELEEFASGFDAAACSGPQAIRLVEELGAVRRLADGLLARAAKRVADTAAYVKHGDRSAAELCARVVGVGTGEVKRAIDSANRLSVLPETDRAVREGRISAQEAELITRTAVHDPDAEATLLGAAGQGMTALRDACVDVRARTEDPEQRARRQHAARTLKTWTTTEGMLAGRFELTPEVGGAVKAAIEERTRAIFRRQRKQGPLESHDAYAADALAELVTGTDEGSRGAGATVHVVIDHEALVRGRTRSGEQCEIPGVGPVSTSWVRELLGEAFVTAVVRKGRDISTVAHLGRHIPAELRTAMIVRGRECSVEGCSARHHLELDHCEIDHARGGPTAWWNLAWLCSVHHKRKTQGWHLGTPDPETGKRSLRAPPGSTAA